MAHIKDLHKVFLNLPMSKDNLLLYNALLSLDISDFKPVMEKILKGEIDIEDTRKIFYNNGYFRYSRYVDGVIKDARLANSDNMVETIINNINAKLTGRENDIIKEGLIVIDNDDLKHAIAKEFEDRTGERLSDEDIEDILPIVENELYLELSLYNPNANHTKELQNLFSDLLANKPEATL